MGGGGGSAGSRPSGDRQEIGLLNSGAANGVRMVRNDGADGECGECLAFGGPWGVRGFGRTTAVCCSCLGKQVMSVLRAPGAAGSTEIKYLLLLK